MADDGGWAFPRGAEMRDGIFSTPNHAGLPLRDWFAGQALTGMLAGRADQPFIIGDMVNSAYRHADAMLAEREKDWEAQ